MLGKALLNLFRSPLPPGVAKADSLLTAGDRETVMADLAAADAAEAGLGARLAAFVVGGAEGAVLLHLETLVQQPGSPLSDALLPSSVAYALAGGDDKVKQERRLALRRRVLFGLEAFDAAAMRRFAQVIAPLHASRTYRYGFPGSDASPMWLRSLLGMCNAYGRHIPAKDKAPHAILTAPRLREMLALDGASVAPLVDCLFVDGEAGHYSGHTAGMLGLDGLAAVLAAEPEAVVAALQLLPTGARAAMAEFFARSGLLEGVPAFFEFAFLLAGSGAKVARQVALAALATAPAERVQARAAQALASASADDRLAAVHVLAARGPGSLPALAAHEAGEGTKRVLQAIATARATLEAPQAGAAPEGQEDGPDGYTGMDGRYIAAPPWTPGPDTWPADAADALRGLVRTVNDMARRSYDAVPVADHDDRTCPKSFKPPFDPGIAGDAAAVMAGTLRPARADAAVHRAANGQVGHQPYLAEARAACQKSVAAILDRPETSLAALVRLRLAGQSATDWNYMVQQMLRQAPGHGPLGAAIGSRLRAGADLREVAAVAEAEGFALAPALEVALGRLWGRSDDEEGQPLLWPLLAAHFPLLDAAFKPGGGARSWVSMSVTGLLGLFPAVPRRYFSYLIDRAATGNPAARNQARALLRDAGDLTPIIATMLGSGDQARRIGGARWMAERRDPAAIPALRAALAAEKAIAAKAALLAALAACGDDISAEFSEERLLAEAAAGLPKAKVDYGDLFDAAALPVLHWADGREVPPRVVQWWFARAHKLKQPGGDPLLHMALDRLDRGDAERLGRSVLAAFIGFDTRKAGLEAANAYAAANAPGRHQSYLRWRKDYTEAEAFAELRREKLGEYLGSALAHQGLLALARFAPPAEAVAMVHRYLRDHGKRASQCRALLDAVAANPVPGVLQLILATSQRHKQPGTRKYAGELADALAEDRGWTAAELADRTVPTAGLDDEGVLELPIGERTYRARIGATGKAAQGKAAVGKAAKDAGLALVLENPDGKPVASLPTPADPAEAEEAKAAKKALANAKKELQQTVESQSARLYAAMCAGRVWTVADFDAFLLRHPIAGRLLRRLVLLGLDAGGQPLASFRALDDGTFSDAADEPVALDGFAGIGIAHRVTLGAEASAAWATHLADYEVQPLFEQLQRPVLTAADAAATSIGDRVGWMIDSTTLRAAATALGYQRGSIEDAGCFYAYEKHFLDLGFAAVLGFTGSFVPETERRAGALRELRFVRLRGGKVGWGATGLGLGKVPAVLLSEAWNDLHAVAAAGTGFDAAWEKKAQW